jgi:hypothetical protein
MKYYLKILDEDDWEEVDKETWIAAERAAGFHNTMGQPNEPSTSYWGNTKPGLTYHYGKLDYEPIDFNKIT